jgi:ferredoxin-nitrate reductase
MTYDRLRGGSGIQWPCTDDAPDGAERLYADGHFNTAPDYSETFGEDLKTGAAFTEDEYRAREPGGRAFLQSAAYEPSPEVTSEDYSLILTTGRTVYHFHTRTKTGRAPELSGAAPDVWAELNVDDAERIGVREGERIRIRSPRGAIEAPARLTEIRPGVVFVPFHYGYWDADGSGARAANELTITAWDPVSKQPLFKVAAVRVEKAGG